MGRLRTLFGVMALFALVLVATPVLARPAAAATISSEAQAWLAAAGPQDSTTFLVGLVDDGTQAQADRAAAIADKLRRRTEVHRILADRAARNDGAIAARLQAEGVAGDVSALRAFKAFNGFSVTSNKRAIEALARWNAVATIELDTPITLDLPQAGNTEASVDAVEWNISKIGADRVWSELGIDGTGVLVGGLDSGVRYTHETLRDNYKCGLSGPHTNCWLDAISGQSAPYDDNNHGTHTMGTTVGRLGIGTAPGATWIACKAFNSSGSGSQTDILECFDWFLAPGGNAANAPDVINNSWGSSNGSSTAYQQSVTNWINAGIFPSFSNGNSGPSCNTVGSPASYTNSFGTGATDINDVIASFSSRGPSPFSSSLKPNVSAPGVNVRSAFRSGDSAYGSLSGTSMAAPHVSGLVALLLDANAGLSIDALRNNLTGNALGIAATGCNSSGVPNNIYGYGRIRAFESVQAALGGGPTPTPTPPAGTAPAAPSSLSASAVVGPAVNLTWNDNSSNESGFSIERCSGSSSCTNFSQIATVGAGVTSYQNTGLSTRTYYRYRVQAFNGSGNSGYSNIATVRTRAR